MAVEPQMMSHKLNWNVPQKNPLKHNCVTHDYQNLYVLYLSLSKMLRLLLCQDCYKNLLPQPNCLLCQEVQHCGISLPFTAGTYLEDGLPAIVGTACTNLNGGKPTGAFTTPYYNNYETQGSPGSGKSLDFDASRCSTIYGNSEVVQPASLTVRYYIKF